MDIPKTRACNIQVSGPLAPGVADFRAWLREAGYTPLSSTMQVRLLAHLSRWLGSRELAVADLTDQRVDEFLASRRNAGCSAHFSRRALASLLGFLAAQHALPAASPPPPRSAVEVTLGSFHRYLLQERGLAPSTACAYVGRADRFLQGCAADGDLGHLTAGDVTRAVLAESTALSSGSAQYFVSALRSFLRFCRIEGLVEADLSAAALAVTGRRHSWLPQGISQADAEALLRSCDRRRAVGRRDHAVVMTLLRLGLRASEVGGLVLEDIDWRTGEVVVHGKGRRDERLPLPDDVGEAVADYLRRGRPRTTRREVFLSTIAPVTSLGRSGVSAIVRRACRRAGMVPVGAHRLRHTLACEMVSAGVPLTEIGQVLRHRSLATTAIYARVDLGQLRTLARTWPGGSDQ